MVKETKTSAKTSESSAVRKMSPARTKSPARRGPAPRSPVKAKKSEVEVTSGLTKSASRKSPVRTKSPSRGSPARNRSPGRPKKDVTPPAKIKSPGRPKKDTTPVRKSPKPKSPATTAAGDAKKSMKKAPVLLTKFDTEFSGSDEEYIPKEKPKATVRGRSRKLDLDDIVQTNIKLTERSDSINTYVGEIRRITRNSQAQEDRVVHLKHFDTVAKKLGEFSDDDEISLLSSKPPDKKQKTSILELTGILFQIIFCPIFVIGLYVICNKSQCSFTSLPNWNQFKSISVFFDLRSFLGFSVLAILLAVLSVLPFGGAKVSNLPSKQGKFIYVTNGAASFVVIGLSCVALEYYRFSVSTFIVQHILHLLVSVILFGGTVSFYLYLRSFYVPVSALSPTEVGKPSINGFFYGREVNPRLLNVLDLKMYVLRIRCMMLILADVALLVKGLNLDTKLGPAIANLDWKPLTSHPTLLILVILHLIYSLDCLIFESRSLSSYFIQYEGLGYRTVLGILLSPFFLIGQTKYVIDYKINLASWELIMLSLLYLVGYVLFRLSNNQKDAFRRNPYSPSSANLESISTTQGKKLLCSGYWGFVRQPNILGDIVLHAALLRFGCNAPPVVGVIALCMMLIERATSAQVVCKSKYGTAWDKYCQKVKYVLLPKVY